MGPDRSAYRKGPGSPEVRAWAAQIGCDGVMGNLFELASPAARLVCEAVVSRRQSRFAELDVHNEPAPARRRTTLNPATPLPDREHQRGKRKSAYAFLNISPHHPDQLFQ